MASGLATPMAAVIGLLIIIPAHPLPKYLSVFLTITMTCRGNMSVAPPAVRWELNRVSSPWDDTGATGLPGEAGGAAR